MTLPEPTAAPSTGNFSALAEEFNKSALSFANNQGTTWEALTLKHSVLQKFKAEVDADHIALSAALFEAGVAMLRTAARIDVRTTLRTSEIQTLFSLIMKPEGLSYLPEKASETLVDAALDIIRRSETLKEEYQRGGNPAQELAGQKSALVKLATTVVGYAETLRGQPENAATFRAAKPPMAAPAKLRSAQVLPSSSN